MEQKELRELEDKCIQEHPPACTAACPIHVDARSFIAQMAKGDFIAAYKIMQKTMPFPGILSRICDHPCQDFCKRKEAGDPIAIAALEKACVQITDAGPAKMMALPKKNKKVAVAGSGLSGLTVAFDLAKKGYWVVIFEAGERLGGRLWEISEDYLPPQVITDELAILNKLGVEVLLNKEVGKDIALTTLCKEYDAVYLGLGAEGHSFDLQSDDQGKIEVDPVTFATSREGVFAGGGLRAAGERYSPVGSVADGRRAAISIDRYLQGVSLTASRDHEGPFTTRLYTNVGGVEPLAAVPMVHPGQFYTRHEAMQEADRCLQCQCLECVKVCDYLAHYKGYPKRYLREIYNNESIVKGIHHANKMINSCSLCGLCAEVCPQGLNMGEVIKSARERMVARGKMPPSAHDFPLRDMEFSNSKKFALTRNQPGTGSSRYLFFPGCQLSASSPDHMEKVYTYLGEKLDGGVGLMLRCCGAPAEWVGQKSLFQAGREEIIKQWQEMDRPRVIVACSSCYHIYKTYLPEINLLSLWEIYHEFGLPELPDRDFGRLAIHDACTTRHEKTIHDSVRGLLQQMNCPIEELPLSRETAQCCGFGGLMAFANPELAKEVTQRVTEESDADYVTYCAMCRDRFAARGKPALHLLDLIYGGDAKDPSLRQGPSYSQRRENRARLKNKLLKEVWRETVAEEKGYQTIPLIISEKIRELMEDRLILVEDLQRVIEFAERTGKKMYHHQTGHFLAYYKPVSVTYWVEYTPRKDGFVVHNTYCHRMEIMEEAEA
ncbi:4Fe-4S dicluster domain-containing protein [Desulforamulus ruminis]|uniref:pyridine nucleotide-disulfide oxidoreductase/dicluster-binding protein n=1 Tax=Desulforamulus ruminis TaxID=1564 RepID=UPI002FD9A6C8